MRFNFSFLLLAIALIGLVHSSPVKRQAEDEQTVGEQVEEAIDSAVDTAKEAQAKVEDQVAEVKENVEKTVEEVKSEAVETKEAVEEKVAEVKDKAVEAHNELEESKDSMLESAEKKLNELGEDAKEVHEDLKKKVNEAHEDLKETAEVLHETFNKKYVEVVRKCSKNEDCGNGNCRNSTCACDQGFVSFGNGTCNYEQKTKVSTFLISFFFGPFGADWFHLARDNSNYCWVGVFKLFTGLVIVFGGCFMCCIQFCFAAMDGHKIGAGVRVVLLAVVSILSLVNVIWYMVDLGRIFFDAFPDGNHVPLKPW